MALTLSGEAKVQVVRTAYGIALGHRLHDRRLRIMEVAADSSAHRAGILNGDVLLKVGSIPAPDAASALRALGDSKSTRRLTLERDGREYEVLLRP